MYSGHVAMLPCGHVGMWPNKLILFVPAETLGLIIFMDLERLDNVGLPPPIVGPPPPTGGSQHCLERGEGRRSRKMLK